MPQINEYFKNKIFMSCLQFKHSKNINYIKSCYLLFFPLFILFFYCGKKETPVSPKDNPSGIYPIPEDAKIANTVGFFLNEWLPKNFQIPDYEEVTLPTSLATSTVDIDASKVVAKVSLNMFGQNSVSFIENISDKEPLMTHLKALKPGIIRFPGGSISDTYFWNRIMQDKPPDAPDYLYNGNNEDLWKWNYWYGKNNPSERANLDDYYSLLQKTGSQGMITVNYGYARYGLAQNPVAQAAHLAADWVRYDSGRTKYWEIGNENHGGWEKGYRINTSHNKDGQPEYISGQLYAQHAKIFIDSMRKAASEIDKTIFIGVGVIESQLKASDWLYQNSKAAPLWNQQVMTEMKTNGPDFYVIHSYYLSNEKNDFEQIISSAQNQTGRMVMDVVADLNRFSSPVKPIALTEYNIYSAGSAGSMQQVSFANGMHTIIVLGEAIKNNVGSAVRWNLLNAWDNGADHGMFNKGDEPGATKWNPRPVFYYIYFFQKMFGDRMVQSSTNTSNILSYASSFSSGEKNVILANKSANTEIINLNIKNAHIGKRVYWYELVGGNDNGSFSRKVYVNNIGPEGEISGGPASDYNKIKAKSAQHKGNSIKLALPGRCVLYMVFDK